MGQHRAGPQQPAAVEHGGVAVLIIMGDIVCVHRVVIFKCVYCVDHRVVVGIFVRSTPSFLFYSSLSGGVCVWGERGGGSPVRVLVAVRKRHAELHLFFFGLN